MAEAAIKRHVAYKALIKSLLDGSYVKEEGEFMPSYVLLGSKHASRVNVVGVIVSKELQNYESLLLDDGTARVALRSFEQGMFEQLEIGNTVLVIGRIREYAGQRYIAPEIIKRVMPEWLRYRVMELKIKRDFDADGIESGMDKFSAEKMISNIISIIQKLDNGDGADIEEVRGHNIPDSERIIKSLLESGGIFEVRPGRLKVL